MTFSDTSNKNGILQRIERYALLGDGVITGDDTLKKQVTSDVNEVIHELTNEIILADDNFEWDDPYKSDYPIATTPLVASQRDYQFDQISFLKIKRVDVSWDGSTYYRADPFDSGAYFEGLGNDSDVDGNFDRQEPKYDPKAFGIWLYPRASAADVTAGGKIRLEFQRSFDEFVYTDTTQEPPIDRPFHDLIAIGAAMKQPTLPNNQYNKLINMYGEKQADGTWTGGVGRMLRHYGTRNEDFTLTFNPQVQDYD